MMIVSRSKMGSFFTFIKVIIFEILSRAETYKLVKIIIWKAIIYKEFNKKKFALYWISLIEFKYVKKFMGFNFLYLASCCKNNKF